MIKKSQLVSVLNLLEEIIGTDYVLNFADECVTVEYGYTTLYIDDNSVTVDDGDDSMVDYYYANDKFSDLLKHRLGAKVEIDLPLKKDVEAQVKALGMTVKTMQKSLAALERLLR